ncbi:MULTISPECIES: hypothetical protein [Micromonospora]|uniref:Uncharacterized protein n=1 Tax=Micromonospora yangpuensis TaxID=683228 RepID=A0A1C6U0L3_9ACTN|nr:hypothetical protein [Micromonospora yangpuensis]GGM11624.1 hypothetical protein GCM10012279_32170 [Micromonospora yangpuensis]SCL47584.1 hypothetical protein GA0070617_0627 [Micromonospora yangpuensis]
MTVDREAISGEERTPVEEVSTATVMAYAFAAIVLFGWFLFGWLVLQQGFVASVGEAAGAGFALLLAVTIIGSVRRSRR